MELFYYMWNSIFNKFLLFYPVINILSEIQEESFYQAQAPGQILTFSLPGT